MYKSIKNITKRLLPQRILFLVEPFLRTLYARSYKGNEHHCIICDFKTKRFIENNSQLLCPKCGSISRNRVLWKLLAENEMVKGRILHFSPSRNLYRKFKTQKNVTYISSDLEGEFMADKSLDITRLEESDSSFDLILCFHVLEHVLDDKKAMSELLRVLKPKGSVLLQCPFKEGAIYEDETITTPEAREVHFGQHDHVRVYSVAGLEKRLKDAGFSAVNILTEKEDSFLGVKEQVVLQAQK